MNEPPLTDDETEALARMLRALRYQPRARAHLYRATLDEWRAVVDAQTREEWQQCDRRRCRKALALWREMTHETEEA